MKFAITPCPNDTFSYYHLINGDIKSDLDFVFEDIEALNLDAESGKYPVTKLSFAAYMRLRSKYEILDAGAALGIGTGPVLVVPDGAAFDSSRPVAVPGLNTTAALLLKFYAGKDVKMVPVYFRDIVEAVSSGKFSAGVLIHEGRFVFRGNGLSLAADLGAFWTDKTKLPVPLGCICVRRDCISVKPEIERLIRASIDSAFADFEACIPYVKSKAQYLADDVLRRHITAFVNEYSRDISPIKNKFFTTIGDIEK